jgi:hypothetical protein
MLKLRSGFKFHVAHCVAAAFATLSSSQAADVLTFSPTNDAFVDSSNPSSNFGSKTYLRVDATPTTRSLMKFVVSGIGTRKVAKASLKLFNVNSCSAGGDIHRLASNNWGEPSVTWNSMPALGSTPLASLGAVSSSTTVSVGLTSTVIADGTYSFAIKEESGDGCEYASKESGSNGPRLVVELEPLTTTTASPSPTPSPSPTSTASPAPSPTVTTEDMGFKSIGSTTQYLDGVELKPQSAYKDWSIRKSSGGNVYRFELHQGEARMDSNDVANGKDRTELKHGTTFPMGTEIWESHAFMIEPGALMTSTWNVMGQWHPGAGTPALFFTLSTSDNLLISSRHGSSTNQVKTDFYKAPISRGKWHRVVQRVIFGYQNDAHVQIWLDGKLIVDKHDVSVGYSDSDGT